MRLADLQRAFARRILDGDAAILAELRDGGRAASTDLMGVYEHGYGARLTEVLAADYEKLLAALDQPAFDRMAAGYIDARPSRSPNARDFGQGLADYLAAAAEWRDAPWLAELARLEWALGEVYQAEDPPRLAIEAMAAVGPQDWPRLVFAVADDVRRIDARHGGPEAWLALEDGDDPASAASVAPPGAWLVWRQDDDARFRQLETAEAQAFDGLAEGLCFADLCQAAAVELGPTAAAAAMAGYLRGWIEAGLISGFAFAED